MHIAQLLCEFHNYTSNLTSVVRYTVAIRTAKQI